MNAAEEAWEEENRGENAPRDLAYEDELDEGVRVVGDGEADDSDSEDGDATVHQSDAATTDKLRPETILELAYIDNPNVFDRDATTRRSNARAALRSETGEILPAIKFFEIELVLHRLGR
jgi:activating signal cointegrator complex subunit 2